jgi:hypothetical protein
MVELRVYYKNTNHHSINPSTLAHLVVVAVVVDVVDIPRLDESSKSDSWHSS